MKKHNEGYTLVLVLVVILVLAACATAVLSFSVQNLKTQQRMVERMQAKYAAQGEIEKIVGQLVLDVVYINEGGASFGTTQADKNHAAVQNWIKEKLDITLDNDKIKAEEDSFSCDIPLTYESGVYKIVCEITVGGKIEIKTDDQNRENYHISEIKVSYKSYEISTTTTDGGDGA